MTAESTSTIFSRGLRVLRDDGISGFLWRLLEKGGLKPARTHLYVLESGRGPQDLPQAGAEDVQILKVSLNDHDYIDEITSIDEWKIPRSVTIKDLEDGQQCYIARCNDRIVACGWAIVKNSFWDSHCKREFVLADNEAYIWRGFTVPEFRGQGIIAQLVHYMEYDLFTHCNKESVITLVRTSNAAVLRSFEKSQWRKTGRAGFWEIGGLRLHYLQGKNAFKATTRRRFVSINR
ncbi:hypothetical protein GURASL_19590 [Geotalea uraniireducens]|uniref:N-acetyltransferase domain-containing protein n=1 Tax=Geotalea uraniireducens TaxID=351604 RepID=A0ABM8EKR6_9BACT|nr:GNAT family N-acetyltransferase [Geotalea uraniireducens]BDV43036.1 hypothetical protein GURASL_19590 [Geotalea uraniireducens]